MDPCFRLFLKQFRFRMYQGCRSRCNQFQFGLQYHKRLQCRFDCSLLGLGSKFLDNYRRRYSNNLVTRQMNRGEQLLWNRMCHSRYHESMEVSDTR